ncbi:MAG TPA: 2Fe-2S iron-sulfur cluster-binding protein, partial [Spirochaetota bacterium]|nr:2Fe-2S iron-sulfur cluster-binding protein [Spirochaetota bacterium]
MQLILLGALMFTGVVLLLVVLILLARSKLVERGDIKITINDNEDKSLTVPAGGKLLNVLGDNGIYIPSACGGGGTCGQCKLQVLEGGGDILPTELSLINRKEAREKVRLSCQVNCKQNMKIKISPEIFDIKKWECRVKSNENVATFIKELVLELPAGENVNFRAGGYIQIECPPHTVSFKDFN